MWKKREAHFLVSDRKPGFGPGGRNLHRAIFLQGGVLQTLQTRVPRKVPQTRKSAPNPSFGGNRTFFFSSIRPSITALRTPKNPLFSGTTDTTHVPPKNRLFWGYQKNRKKWVSQKFTFFHFSRNLTFFTFHTFHETSTFQFFQFFYRYKIFFIVIKFFFIVIKFFLSL